MSKPVIDFKAKTVDEQIEQILQRASSQQIDEEVYYLQDLQYLAQKEQILAQARERLQITRPMAQVGDQHLGQAAVQELSTTASQPLFLPQCKTVAWSTVAAVLIAAVLLIVTSVSAARFFSAQKQQALEGNSHSGIVSPTVHVTNTIITTPNPSENKIFSDPLSSNLEHWPINNHQFFFQDGSYHIVTESQMSVVPLPGLVVTSGWSYTLTMTQIQGDLSSQNEAFGMCFAYRNVNGHTLFYTFEMSHTPGNEYRLVANDQVNQATNWYTLWSKGAGPELHKGLNVANTVKITAQAHALTFTVNGQNIGTVPNITLDSGQIGMMSHKSGFDISNIAFQNLLVTRP